MLKLIGSLLIICSAGLAGLRVGAVYSLRTRQLRALQEALQLLDTEIMYGATPLPAALRKVAAATGGCIGPVFRDAGGLLGTSDGYSAREAWSLAFDRNFRRTALRQEDLAILKSFGEALGSSDRNEQHKHIELTVFHLRQESEKAETACQKNERIWQYGGFLVGISLVLLFL
ncbi:MAG: stage III sporulation protein SpoIIIAB [Thermacetogeniaceae bacterium]